MPSLELEDQPWFPLLLRQYQMEYLSWLASKLGLYSPLAGAVRHLLQRHASRQWTDCCSGAAGPVSALLTAGVVPQQLVLADRYPQPALEVLPGDTKMAYYQLPQDAIPGEGLVTMFNALHHFSPATRLQWLQQVAAQRRPLLVAEITRPTLLCWVAVTLAGTVGVWLFTPFIRPFCWKRLFFTYLLPLNVLSITWDGWMSVFSAIRRRSFQAMATEIGHPAYATYFYEAGPWWQRLAVLAAEPVDSSIENTVVPNFTTNP